VGNPFRQAPPQSVTPLDANGGLHVGCRPGPKDRRTGRGPGQKGKHARSQANMASSGIITCEGSHTLSIQAQVLGIALQVSSGGQ